MQHLDEGLLQAWLDHPRSGLEPSEVAEIERHLASCSACARALVFTVAINLVRDEARTVVRRKRHLALLKVEADVTEEASSSPADSAERTDAVERLRQALEMLSERDREVLLLWDAGLNYVEISAQTGLAKTAIGTTIARAKRKLVEAHAALEANDAALG